MKMKLLTVWVTLALLSGCVVTSTAGAHRARVCNFRIVRDIMRRACAYHSLENSQLFGLEALQAPDGNGIAAVGVRSPGYAADDAGEHYPHDPAPGSRAKKEMELLYIRRILKECCPNEGCPPLSKFCR